MNKIIEEINITNIDLKNTFFHYTDNKNLKNIGIEGLEPRIGKNSKGIEMNEKIFFAMGDTGVLILMDAWLRWLILRPKNSKIYELGSYFIKKSYFPKIIVDIIFKNWIKDKKRLNRAIKNLKTILDNSVFLVLDLEENIDFSFDDVDEVKAQNYSKEQLKYVYCYDDSDVDDKKVEYWNMHTYVNKSVEKEKIKLLKLDNEYSANSILKHFASNKKEYIYENCEFLKEYLKQLDL